MNTVRKWTRQARLGAPREATRAGRQRPSPWGVGLACIMVCLISHTAGAVPLTTLPQVVAFSGAVAVTDTKATPGATTANGASFPSITVNKYTGADILTGVQL